MEHLPNKYTWNVGCPKKVSIEEREKKGIWGTNQIITGIIYNNNKIINATSRLYQNLQFTETRVERDVRY